MKTSVREVLSALETLPSAYLQVAETVGVDTLEKAERQAKRRKRRK